MKRPEPWTGRLLRVETDLPTDFNEFFEDLAEAGIETFETWLAASAADERGDSA